MHLVRNRLLPLLLVALPLTTAMAGSRPRVQHEGPQAVEPAGTWKGASVCLRGRAACGIDVVAFHIAAEPSRPGHLAAMMDRLVDGREEEIAVLDCRFDAASATLECPTPAGTRPGVWRFRVRSGSLDGGLTLADGATLRRLHLVRAD